MIARELPAILTVLMLIVVGAVLVAAFDALFRGGVP